MTTPGNLICSKCGYSNVPGDQFCGSCGSFLEWGAVPGDVAPGPVPSPDPVPGPGPVPGPPLPVPTGPDPGPPSGALIRCPNCGIANPPDRTFCQSCGSKLAEAGRVVPATPEQIATAVNQGPVVWTATPNVTSSEEDGSGSRTKVLIALCVLGVLLGVGVIAGYSLLRGGGGAETGASPNPSVVASGGSGALPTGSATVEPTGSASAGPTDEPTSSPGAPAVELAINDVTASSSAPNFPISNVHDGDDQTAWKEGVRSEGQGESITLRFDPATVTAIVVSNGFSKDETSYNVNPRVRAIDVSVNGRRATRIVLKDTPDRTTYELDTPIEGARTLKITIVSVYPGEDSGGVQARPSTALGEIVVMGVTTP